MALVELIESGIIVIMARSSGGEIVLPGSHFTIARGPICLASGERAKRKAIAMDKRPDITTSGEGPGSHPHPGKTWGYVGTWLAVIWIVFPSPILIIGSILWPLTVLWLATLAVPIIALAKSGGRYGRWGLGLNIAFVVANTAFGMWNLARFP